jgi:hypothetical protein
LDAPLEQKWSNYKQKFGKVYGPEEDSLRFESFKETVKYIDEAKIRGVRLGLNDMADSTSEEQRLRRGMPGPRACDLKNNLVTEPAEPKNWLGQKSLDSITYYPVPHVRIDHDGDGTEAAPGPSMPRILRWIMYPQPNQFEKGDDKGE